jgi:hypothetical protein
VRPEGLGKCDISLPLPKQWRIIYKITWHQTLEASSLNIHSVWLLYISIFFKCWALKCFSVRQVIQDKVMARIMYPLLCTKVYSRVHIFCWKFGKITLLHKYNLNAGVFPNFALDLPRVSEEVWGLVLGPCEKTSQTYSERSSLPPWYLSQ